MSLDFYLTREEREGDRVPCGHCDGRGWIIPGGLNVYERNITHNLCGMASEAGVYVPLWRPDEHGMTHARDLIDQLQRGLDLLLSDALRFRVFDAPNGWGQYDGFVEFVRATLAACREYPDANVSVSR